MTDPEPRRRSSCAFAVGDGVQRRFEFTVDNIRHYAVLTGDDNPLHHDQAVAATSRFGCLIACAGQSISLMTGALATFLIERGGALGLEFSFRMRRAVKAGDVLRLTWTIESIAPDPRRGGDIAILMGTLASEDGEPSVLAQAKALILPPDDGRQRA